ncbi:MAG: hypothetical protein EBS05_15355 [Proteobacteria bacterium]|nr:hypothetical protein [Pseudomonadota bacterium]
MILERGLRPKDAIAASLFILFLAGMMLCNCPFLFLLACIVALLGWSKGTRVQRVVIALLATFALFWAIIAGIAEVRLQSRVKTIKEKCTNSVTHPVKP